MVVQQLKKLGARIVYYRKIQSVTQEKFAHRKWKLSQKCIFAYIDEDSGRIGDYYKPIAGRHRKGNRVSIREQLLQRLN